MQNRGYNGDNKSWGNNKNQNQPKPSRTWNIRPNNGTLASPFENLDNQEMKQPIRVQMANVALKNWCEIHNINVHAKLDCPQFHLTASIFNVEVQTPTSKFLIPKGNKIVPSGFESALVLESFIFTTRQEENQIIEDEPYYCEILYPESALVLDAFQFPFETENEVLCEPEEV